MEDDLRSDLASALREGTTNVSTIEIEETTTNLPAVYEPKEDVTDEPATSAGEDDTEAAKGTPPARDATGRFAPKTPAQDTLPADGDNGTQAEVDPAKTAAPEVLKAPFSWRPEEREGWAGVPASAQKAILRRETEMQTMLNNTLNARRFFEGFQQIAAPYQQLFQTLGTNPMQAFDHLLRTANFLYTGPRKEKAEMVADMIMRHDVDIEMLDTALHAMKNSGPITPIDVERAVQRALQAAAPRAQQQVDPARLQFNHDAQLSINEFMSKNEFANDVREDMADLMDMAARRGQQMSLQDAYNRAILAHPTISKILEGRRGKDPAQLTAAAIRARNASASVSDSGAPSQKEEAEDGDDLRSAVTASIRQHAKAGR